MHRLHSAGINFRKHVRDVPDLLELSSEAVSLRPIPRPSAPVFPCTPVVSQQPQQPTSRHALNGRPLPTGWIPNLGATLILSNEHRYPGQ